MARADSIQAQPVDQASLDVLRQSVGSNCVPSAESVAELQGSDLVLMSGQFVGAGKSTFIHELEAGGRVNIPSWTNRELRPGEVEGIDKIRGSLPVMAQKAIDGYFLEIEEVRPGVFYATPAEFTPGKSYVKDLELKGALRLRSFAPKLPIVVPIPPIDRLASLQVTEWERRVVGREGLAKSITDKAIDDLKGRLAGVVEEADRIEELDMAKDPYTLLVINDDLPQALQAMHRFLQTGERTEHADIADHVRSLKQIASAALAG